MAHFAQLNDSNTVLTINVIADADCLDGDGNESEAVGIAFCKSLWGSDTTWIQTSYNYSFRKNYARPNFTYDKVRDAFIPPRPGASWTLDEDTCTWEAPVAYPDDGKFYEWDEATTNWKEIT